MRRLIFFTYILFLLIAPFSSAISDDRLQQIQNRLSQSSRILIRPGTMNHSAEDRLLALASRSASIEDTLIEALEVSSRELRSVLARSNHGSEMNFADIRPSLERTASAVQGYLVASGADMWDRVTSSVESEGETSRMFTYLTDTYERFDGSFETPSILALEGSARELLFGRSFDQYSVKRLIDSIDRTIVVLGRKAAVR